MAPGVTFVVPCYNLAHLLNDCIGSILSQSYSDFEVLIMDDCSPDSTRAVALSFQDPRVEYVRNETNLGHLRNYNKGIGMARGKYVWLISADDKLRCSDVLQRYIDVMNRHPNVGYVCCPGIGLENGRETRLLECGYYGTRDTIFNGRHFIAASLRNGYGLLAPSVMVRKDCYDRISMFPTDMPHQGDWYLWFLWALQYDVAYVAEPMVNYRIHELNIMKDLIRRSPETVLNDELEVLWRTKRECERREFRRLAESCEERIAAIYTRALMAALYSDLETHWYMTFAECYRGLRLQATDMREYRRMRGKLFGYIGNQHWRHGALDLARQSYARALRHNWRAPRVWLSWLALSTGAGRMGGVFRKFKRGNDFQRYVRNV